MAQSMGSARARVDNKSIRSTKREADATESWVEISSQPSSSSLSSTADESTRPAAMRRRRTLQHLGTESAHGTSSSQEEYDESESESDRVMTSSGEGQHRAILRSAAVALESDDDENRTAVNYPTNSGNVFTPQPNAFSQPPVSGSYFPYVNRARPTEITRRSDTHTPRNVLSPSYAHHDEALRNSLSTLLSCAAAARGLKDTKDPKPVSTRNTRIEPMTLHLVPESALPRSSPAVHSTSPTFDLQAPVFKPTLRRHSTTTTSTSPDRAREKAKERRVIKKVRRSSSVDDLISPTLLTWVVSAGVVVFLSALSFSAGYSMGKEAGRIESTVSAGNGVLKDCAREASSGLGLKRTLARSAVQAS